MKIARYLLLALCSLPVICVAHDNSMATVQIIHTADGEWMFVVGTPLYELDQSVRRFHQDSDEGDSELTTGSREYKKRLVQYIKSGFNLNVATSDGHSVVPVLGKGRMKLDNHQTQLAFEIKNMPAAFDKLEFKFAYMSGNNVQQNVVRLVDGDRTKRYTLSASNNFEGLDNGFFGQ